MESAFLFLMIVKFSHRGQAMKIIVPAHTKDNQQPLFSEA